MGSQGSRLRAGDVVHIRGERWRVLRSVSHGRTTVIDVEGRDASGRTSTARFLLPFETVAPVRSTRDPLVVRPGRWRRVARAAIAEASPSWWSPRAATRANLTLHPYQLEPALAMARGNGCRFLIADAVGLGKTIQAGLMIAETLQRRPDARAMVVSPAGLREQWCGELQHRFGLAAEIFDAAGIARMQARLPADVNPWALPSLAITSIDYVKRPEILRALEGLTWDALVFDEAHNLAGSSDRHEVATMLALRARVVVLLTATPHSGDEHAFSRLCDIGRGRDPGPLVVFRRTRSAVRPAAANRSVFLRVRLTPDESAMHAALMTYARQVWRAGASAGARLAMSVLARRACSSAESLARSVERRLALLSGADVPLSTQGRLPFDDGSGDEAPDAVLGARGLRDAADEQRTLEVLLRMARTAARAESKVAAIRRILRRTREPAIVFTEYRDTLQSLAAGLRDVEAVNLHGGLTARERRDALGRFTSGDTRLLLATDAGSEGLNLHQRCRLVINLELPWTPTRLEQRAGRVDRIGQTRRVHVVHLMAAGSCEESTLARLAQRIERLRGTMDLFTRFPDERRIAESVVAGRPLPDPEVTPPTAPVEVTTLDLRREAEEESRRIGRARVLLSGSGEAVPVARPVVTHFRIRRGAPGPARAVWVFRMVFADAGGGHAWDALVPLGGGLSLRPARSPWVTRAALDPRQATLQRLLRHAGEVMGVQLHRSRSPALELWSARERMMVVELRSRQARLSAVLLQRGLFDARRERGAASQQAALDEALSHCDARLRELAAAANLHVDSCELVFGAMLG